MKKIIMTLLCVICALSFSFANAKKTDPWVEWRRGYELFLEGDKFMRRNKLEDALSAYRRSRDTYRRVLEANTGWNKNLINSKISACETQILKIERRLRETSGGTVSRRTAPKPAAKPAPSYSSTSQTTASTQLTQDDEYKRKYFELYIVVENLRKQLRSQAQAVKNIDALLKEKRLAEEKASTFQRTINDLKKQLAQPEKDLADLRKQLIAERLKNEKLVLARTTDSNSINNLQQEVRKFNATLADLEIKLKNSNSTVASLNSTIKELRNRISGFDDERAEHRKEINKLTDARKTSEKSLSAAQNEIKKLNSWIDELNKKKGDSDKISNNIVSENRKLKTQNSTLQKQFDDLKSTNNENIRKIQQTERNLKNISDTLAVLNSQKQNLEKELKLARELYVKQLNADKLAKSELDTLRREHKKNTENLRTYINRNAELTAMLETKDSATINYAKKIDSLQKEITEKNSEIKKLNNVISGGSSSLSTKRLAQLSDANERLAKENDSFRADNRKLTTENNSLISELKAAKNELAVLRTPNSNAAKGKNISSAGNHDYTKLLAAYNDLKNKYDFLSAEVESLTKPLAEINESEPEINSDKELAAFLLKAASDAAKSNDIISAAWYFSELKKQDKNNVLYNYGHALYTVLSSEYAAAVKAVSPLADCKEKFILSGICAMLNGDARSASANFSRASEKGSVSPDVLTLYRKELNLIISLFAKTNSMKSSVEHLKTLLK